MVERPAFNFEEAIHGVKETQTALKHAEACMDRLERLLSERPQSFAPLAQLAFRLRDRLIEDLGTLEARLAQEGSAPAPEPRKAAPEGQDAPLADVVALGGQ
jgi:hypothetical protein